LADGSGAESYRDTEGSDDGSHSKLNRMHRYTSTGESIIDVLVFVSERVTASIGDIVDAMSIPRSTAYRYIKLLRDADLLRKIGSGVYSVGPRAVQLDASFQEALRSTAPYYQAMRALQAETHETVALLVPMGDQATCIATVESSEPLRYTFSKGRSSSFLRGASAKAMLPWLPTQQIERLMQADPRFDTAGREELMRQREQIAADGFVISSGEIDEGVWAVGAPVLHKGNKLRAAISVIAPVFRVRDREAAIVTRAVAAAAELSEIGDFNYVL